LLFFISLEISLPVTPARGFESHRLPQKTFILYTSGTASRKYAKNFSEHLTQIGLQILGIYRCKGYDTYGFWKLIGGIAKGHPNEVDIVAGVSFIKNTIIQGL
jgi:hypothetical protein